MVNLEYIRTEGQSADIFTKAVHGPRHQQLTRKIAVLEPFKDTTETARTPNVLGRAQGPCTSTPPHRQDSDSPVRDPRSAEPSSAAAADPEAGKAKPPDGMALGRGRRKKEEGVSAKVGKDGERGGSPSPLPPSPPDHGWLVRE